MIKLNAGIIVIGNEILSGRTKDTNSNFIANKLIKNGIKLEKITVIPDNEKIIIDTVRDFHKYYKYVFTTGGIGPTHDDITSESISKAFKKKYSYHPQAYKILKDYYPKNEFNKGRKKMAKMPEGSELIINPLTIAPGYIIKNVYVLPGVPMIMKKMFNLLLKNLDKGKPKKTLTIRTNIYESVMALELSRIQKKNKKCAIGSYPYFNYLKRKGGVNIVISSWELENLNNIRDQIKKMIKLLGGKSFLVYK
ncbi:MAG: CinA-like protein [Alphaproteobacteria bacterium MarineAlpha5_Bin6]|nr:MAG: CinA-like protein [Alphaproteobacteria bacterium MarineAlpha5_Bin7]PPR54002.1 MAG: CinA-like protein [Alphaproteobacteria bacterium MarineAlpha5_Bin6]|tara:strand:+ start:3763 stop:4515 length:753 start_codon:yes stop_codon:yes gene_type:complete